MKISCVHTGDELGGEETELILFPEYAELAEIRKAAKRFPKAIVAGAARHGRRSKAWLLSGGENRVDYLKVGSDGMSEGTETNPSALPVFELPGIAVGLLICKDIQYPELRLGVVDKLRASQSGRKILCIPAFMDSSWFSGGTVVGQEYSGVNVILCNHPLQDRPRCKSFIADGDGLMLLMQKNTEALHFEL